MQNFKFTFLSKSLFIKLLTNIQIFFLNLYSCFCIFLKFFIIWSKYTVWKFVNKKSSSSWKLFLYFFFLGFYFNISGYLLTFKEVRLSFCHNLYVCIFYICKYCCSVFFYFYGKLTVGNRLLLVTCLEVSSHYELLNMSPIDGFKIILT